MGIADGDVTKMRAEIEANLKREVKRRIEGKLKDQVMEALIKANPISVPSALVDMEIQRLMQAARQDMEQRGMKVKDMPIQPEWFADQAKRRVTLGLILAELVKTEKLQATPEQVRAMVEETPRATSSRKKSFAGTTPNRSAWAKWKVVASKTTWSNGCWARPR
jgi:trigger factor